MASVNPGGVVQETAVQDRSRWDETREVMTLTAPVAMAYIPLGLAFGVLMVTSGIPWYWAPVSALVILAGSIEFLAVALIAGGVPFPQVFVTAVMVQFRHVFYGLTFPLQRIPGRVRKAYGVWALTDETYAITAAGPGSRLNGFQITLLQVVSHAWWASSALLGALVGGLVPPYIVGFGFALTAMFITLLVDSLRNDASKFQLAAAAVSIVVAWLVELRWPDWFLIVGLLSYLAMVTVRFLMVSSTSGARKELR